MIRLRISLAVLGALLLGTQAWGQYQAPRPPANREFEREVGQITVDVLKYTDLDANNRLDADEAKIARAQVIEKMVDRLPSASYISGGEHTVRHMRRDIDQMAMDRDGDRIVDEVELARFVGFAVARSQRAARTPYAVQVNLMREEVQSKELLYYHTERELQRRRLESWKWRLAASQQRKETWHEIQARRLYQRLEAQRDIARAKLKGDQEALLREVSPGLVPGNDGLRPTPLKPLE